MLCFTAAENCEEIFEQESGTIDYPLGGTNYGYNEYCLWVLVKKDPSSAIFVEVTEFNVEHHPTCDSDYLKVSIYYIHAIKTYLDYKFSNKLFVRK